MIKEFQKEYRWLSNFTLVDISFNSITYPSVEHAYCSFKSNDLEWKKTCADKNITSAQIKKLAKSIKVVDNWDDIKLSIMEKCIDQKYNQEPFKTLLLETKNEMIQEGNYWNDTYWGFCLKTNKGKNNLGKLLMEKRKQLRTLSLF